MKTRLLALMFGISWLTPSFATAAPARPPQFVALAFDGSYEIARWQSTRDFARELKAEGIDLHFTYFISGVYFLHEGTKTVYQGPRHAPGKSDIGFGDHPAGILKRIGQVNAAYAEGHEIGSHANGHFDGGTWTRADWEDEFRKFNSLIFGAFANNRLQPGPTDPRRWEFDEREVVGFRAPLLATSPGLWPALPTASFRYDTSRITEPTYWPEKLASGWNFPLARMRIAGTGKWTLSMDYNFYVAQSAAKDIPAQAKVFEKQMVETYLRYFQANYNGNRAPVHIGHHFGLWNGGAYWSAMKKFARAVCGLPEVRCVTYRELADWMDARSPIELAAYRQGAFPKGQKLELPTELGPGLDLGLKLEQAAPTRLVVDLNGSQAKKLMSRGMRIHWELDGKTIAGHESAIDLSTLDVPAGESELSAVATYFGREVYRTTHKIDIPEDADASVTLSADDLESRALVGDLPEAHRIDPSSEN